MADSWKKIGRVGLPQGLGGSFFLSSLAVKSSAEKIESVVIGEDPSSGLPALVESKKIVKGGLVLKLRGVESREALQGLYNQSLWVEKGELEDTDLEGMSVFDTDKNPFGRVVAVTNYGASDILVIEGLKGKFIDLPFIPEYFSLTPAQGGTLHLVMENSSFEELWYE